jgi:hypothetical protein
MAVLADDMNSDKTFVVEKGFRTENVEPGYMDRSDQKYGRRGPKRKPQGSLGLNTAVNGKSPRDSPYSSPTASNDERRRSPHRFSHGPNSSPRHQVSSPLARVNEEIDAPIPARAGGDVIKDFATAVADTGNSAKPDKLVDAPTPVEVSTKKEKLIDAPTPVTAADDRKKEFAGLARITTMPTLDEDKENHQQRYQSKVWALTDWTTT